MTLPYLAIDEDEGGAVAFDEILRSIISERAIPLEAVHPSNLQYASIPIQLDRDVMG